MISWSYRRVMLPCLVSVFSTIVPATAAADCHGDGDCKAGRICRSGRCVAAPDVGACQSDSSCPGELVCEDGNCVARTPPAEKKSQFVNLIDPAEEARRLATLSEARFDILGSSRYGVAGWVLMGSGAGLDAISAVLAFTSQDFVAPVTVASFGISMLTMGGIFAGVSAGNAAHALELVGGVPTGPGLRIAGWVVYGVSMASLYGTIILGAVLIGPVASLVAMVPIAGAVVATILFEVDAGINRARFEALVSGDPRSATPTSSVVTPLDWAPSVVAGRQGVASAVVVAW